MELLFEGNLNDPLWMNTVPFSGFNSTCRFAPAGFCCGDYCVIPLRGLLQQKLYPARRFAPVGFKKNCDLVKQDAWCKMLFLNHFSNIFQN